MHQFALLNFFTRRISILYHLIFRKWLFEYFDPVTVTAAYNTFIRDYFGFTVFNRNSIELVRILNFEFRTSKSGLTTWKHNKKQFLFVST